MTMATLGSICKYPVRVVVRGTSIRDAAGMMRLNHVGALVVVDDISDVAMPLVIVTDHDIVVAIVALDLDPGIFLIDDLLDRPLTVARVDQQVREGWELMNAKGVRRLPLVDGNGRLAGIVSLGDVLGELAKDIVATSTVVEREIGAELATHAGRIHVRQGDASDNCHVS